MRFADIPGLKEEKKRLIDFFESDKIHHALLFFGLEGSSWDWVNFIYMFN